MAVRAGGSGTDICEGLAATVSGSLMMIGEFGGQASFGAQTVDAGGTSSYFVARWRADGSIDGVVADGGGSYRPPMDFTWQPMTLHVDRAGNSYVGISYLNTIRIGDSSYRSASEADAAVVMYRADGSRAWTHVYSGMWLQLVQGMTTDADGNLYVSGFSQDLPQGEVFIDKLSPAGELDWELTSGWGSSASDAQGGPMCVDGAGNVILAGPFGGAPTFGNFVVRSIGSDSLGTIVGDDIYIATIGATSGVPAMKDRDATDPRYAIARRGDALLVIPREDAPAILDAALYSTLGQRAAWTDGTPLESGATLRVELDGTARGAWLLVLRTAEGTACYPVMIAR